MAPVPFYYLAYGSNLPTLRMIDRTSRDIVLKGKFAWAGQRLAFSKKSVDGSAKCTAVATSPDRVVWGAIFEMTAVEKATLTKAEVGYHEVSLMLPVEGDLKLGFTFVADKDQIDDWLYPYVWYKRMVVAGAREHGFPPEYIAQIEGATARPDPDHERSAKYEPLLAQFENAPRAWTATL